MPNRNDNPINPQKKKPIGISWRVLILLLAGPVIMVVVLIVMMMIDRDDLFHTTTIEDEVSWEPGLLVRFIQSVDGQNHSDVRTARLAALHIDEGEPPTPFLNAGPFESHWEGRLNISIEDYYTFHFEGNGNVEMSLDGKTVLQSDGTGDETESQPLQLSVGSYELLIQYHSPQEGPAQMRMIWSGDYFIPEPILPEALSHDAGDKKLLYHEQLRRGRELIAHYSCLKCHNSQDPSFFDGEIMPELNRDAPDLNGVGGRLRAGWLQRWLEDPHALFPSAKMPQMNFDSGEIADITAWLATLGEVPFGDDGQSILKDKDRVTEGGHLYALQGCVACHTLDAAPNRLRVEADNANESKTDGDRLSLSGVASKWYFPALVEYLRDPSRHYAWTGMPDFRLDGREAESLAAFLISETDTGSENDANGLVVTGDVQRGKRLVSESGCASCHAAPVENLHVAPSLDALSEIDWLRGWLSSEVHSDASDHPRYPGLDEQDRKALIALAAEGFGSLKHRSPIEFARRQVVSLDCRACHEIDGWGNRWSDLENEVAHFKKDAYDPPFSQRRPSLTWTGEKLQPEWLTGLLAGTLEHEARPWLEARMPALGAKPKLMTRGLANKHGYDGVEFKHPQPDPDLLSHGKRLATTIVRGFRCHGCHHGGAGGGAVAPALNLLGDRLRPEFFNWILHSPHRIDPRSGMPRFGDARGRTRFVDLFDGDAEIQFQAMWHYLVDSRISRQDRLDPDDEVVDRDTRWMDLYQQMDIGPFYSGTIEVPGDGVRPQGLSIRVGDEKQANLHFDHGLLRVSAGWTGEFLEFRSNNDWGIRNVPPPAAAGDIWFTNPEVAGWSTGEIPQFEDPRDEQMGPLPEEQGYYKGLYLHGKRTVLSYSVAGTSVLDSPWYFENNLESAFIRDLQVGGHSDEPLSTLLLDGGETGEVTIEKNGSLQLARISDSEKRMLVAVNTEYKSGVNLILSAEGFVALRFDPQADERTIRVLMWTGEAGGEETFLKLASRIGDPDELDQLIEPGPDLWGSPLVTRGELGDPGEKDATWVVDRIIAPVENPYNAMIHFTDVDFLDDRRAVLSTMHGDVWLVDGIDNSLDRLEWRRFATGLNMPFGVRVVDGKIYVSNEDELTILHDRSGNGEADYYENFRTLIAPGPGAWRQAFGLEVDDDGYFYFARGRGATDELAGVFKVSPDGRQKERIATGFRQPWGMGISPEGHITVSQQEGTWVPQTPVNMIDLENRRGSFYGFDPDRLRWENPYPRQSGYEPPIVWMPRNVDNSGAGQAWVTSDRWGLPRGQMLHFAYGPGAILQIMYEMVEGDRQGAVVPVVQFDQLRPRNGRFRQQDGQLYAVGHVPSGGFKRVRYTGGKVYLPVAHHAHENGIRIRFKEPLNPELAGDIANYTVHRWNYRWTGDYGSGLYSVQNPDLFGEDEVEITSVHVLDDGREVFLEIPDMVPVMQMRIAYELEAVDGTPIREDLYNTIHSLRPAFDHRIQF